MTYVFRSSQITGYDLLTEEMLPKNMRSRRMSWVLIINNVISFVSDNNDDNDEV